MPANPLKGEVEFAAAGATYTLAYTIDALCTLEDRLNISVSQIGERMAAEPRLSFLRAVFHAGLREHHGAICEKAAGELMMALGIDKAGEAIGKAFFGAFSKPEDGQADVDPQTAAAG